MQEHVFGIHERDDAVEGGFPLDFVVHKERLSHWPRVGHTGRFDEYIVELVAPFHQVADDADQIASNGAADASVVHLKYFFFGVDDQILIDADFAEFIFDHGNSLAVLSRENVIQEGRLPRAQKSGENRDRDAFICRRGHWLNPISSDRALILWRIVSEEGMRLQTRLRSVHSGLSLLGIDLGFRLGPTTSL